MVAGAAWATPAILVAASTPALAASGGGGPSGAPAGVVSLGAQSHYQDHYWVADLGANVKAKVLGFYAQLRPDAGQTTAVAISSLTLTVVVTKADSALRWGIGNALGGTSTWRAVGSPTVSGHTATLVLTYAGALPSQAYEGINLDNFWFEVNNAKAEIAASLSATDANGRTLTAFYGPA